MKRKEIRVVELFAGVGGFRLGLEGWQGKSPSSGYTKSYKTPFKVVWSNQWEPSTKTQHASEIYVKNFGAEGHSNKDISTIPSSEIPDHDLLVGGFPCQDYSVAKTLNHAKGLVGKKGVLWWEIHRIAKEKQPKYIFLENVDRLLKSPAKQRGRDFAIMLASLSDIGYAVEWRVINAADYGMPQKRRRVFILAYHTSTRIFGQIAKQKQLFDWTLRSGIFAQAFPVEDEARTEGFNIAGDLADITETFNRAHSPFQGELIEGARVEVASDPLSPFLNAGVMIDRAVSTSSTVPKYDGNRRTLGDVVLRNGSVPAEYYLEPQAIDKWQYLKGAKAEQRTNKGTGFQYKYSEGPLPFPDPLDRPARTIITGEGGATPSRFKHVIEAPNGQLRRLTPIELERLNMFPDNHTEGVLDGRRAFFMGNALVVGIVEKVARYLINA